MTRRRPPPEVAIAYDAFPKDARARLMEVRDLVFEAAAEASGAGPIREALRWGEPAFLTGPGIGSSIRLAWKPRTPSHVGAYFICNTNLVDRFRSMFGEELTFEGDRAILLPIDGDLPTPQLKRCFTEALTYHLAKKQRRRSVVAR